MPKVVLNNRNSEMHKLLFFRRTLDMKKAMGFISFLVLSAATFSQPSMVVNQKDVEAICKNIR